MSAYIEHSPIDEWDWFGNPHFVQPVGIRLVSTIEPRAITCLPFQTTYHAELSEAATSHVIAAFLEFDH